MKNIFFILAIMSTQVFSKSITYKIENNEYEGYLINKGKNAPVIFIIHD